MILPEEFFLCVNCADGLKREEGETPVPGDGPEKARIFLIGESAGAEEMKKSKPFQGKAGENLNQFLSSIGLNRADIYISNTTRCRPYHTKEKVLKDGTLKVTKSNRPPGTKEIHACAKWLDYEIAKLSPSLIVTLGAVPLKRLTGLANISEVHGKLQETFIQRYDMYEGKFVHYHKPYLLFPLYHPASIIYRRELKEIFDQDLKELKQVICQLNLNPSVP